jgi:hypothetical protein
MHKRWCALLLPLLACSGQTTSSEQSITLAEVKSQIRPVYFAPLHIKADLEIERRDDTGVNTYGGELELNRSGISSLRIEQPQTFRLTMTADSVAFSTGSSVPLSIDLPGPQHNIVRLREVNVLEFNPFRYLNVHYDYSLDTSRPDTTLIWIREAREESVFGDIKVVIEPMTGRITDLYFYSVSGDLGRHVRYASPERVGDFEIPSKVIIDHAAQAMVIHEIYRLKDIRPAAKTDPGSAADRD